MIEAGWHRYLEASGRVARAMERRRRAAVRLADAIGELVDAAIADGMEAESVSEVLEEVRRRVGS